MYFFKKLGARSYREGNDSWSRKWEQMSYDRAKPKHVASWTAGDEGSVLFREDYQ